MAITFQKIAAGSYFPAQTPNTAYLRPDNWDDFGHETLFILTVFDEHGNEQLIGNIKIGYVGQAEERTKETIPQRFDVLPETFYSLGQDSDYYRNIVNNLSDELAANILTALGDVAYDPKRLAVADNEDAFNISLLRSVNRTSIENQFRRILRHEAEPTEFDFFYEKAANERYSGVKVEFKVEPKSKPSSNIHILIGRNGVGKTTLLNNMVDALLPDSGEVEQTGYFAKRSLGSSGAVLGDDYFAGVVSISFSAFDPFTRPVNQPDANAGMRYSYVGLRKRITQQGKETWGIKDDDDLCGDFISSLKVCFALTAKRDRWVKAVKTLESDDNISEMDLCQLDNVYVKDLSDNKHEFLKVATSLFKRMSSGHSIVLLTITKLVETVEEKTLVLFDEPEWHLHPPLLSAFTRALSDLLVNRNGVAIIATHSPVVLQEIPKSCVSILRRIRLITNVDRPDNETFAENVGVLTREVFGLEVAKSGFLDLLRRSVAKGYS